MSVALACEQARQAQQAWASKPLSYRQAVLTRFLTLFVEHAETMAQCLLDELHKPQALSYSSELAVAANQCRYNIRNARRAFSPKSLGLFQVLLTGGVHRQEAHPYGVVGIITPWNYPIATAVSAISAALLAGNGVVLKPSEYTPRSTQAVVDLFWQALGPEFSALLQLLPATIETGEALCQADIDALHFTGSTRVGQKIQAVLGPRFIPTQLELGGNDAALVLYHTLEREVLSHVLWSRMVFAGQSCAAIKRLFVPQSVLPDTLTHLTQQCQQLVAQADGKIPLVSQRQYNTLVAQVAQAVAMGAQLIAPSVPEVLTAIENYYPPSLLIWPEPPPAHWHAVELFGPVLQVFAYDHVQAAVAQINASPYGLTASVFGPYAQATSVARQLHVGTVVVNDTGLTRYACPQVPWHGWKHSGNGTSHGLLGLRVFCRWQTVSHNLFWPLVKTPPWLFTKTLSGDTWLNFGHGLLHMCAGTSPEPKRLSFIKALWKLCRTPKL